MQKAEFINSLINNGIKFKENEKMSAHTTFKIGGGADIFVTPETTKQFIYTVKSANEYNVEYFVLGNGSNLLVSDDGIEGAVISTLMLNVVKCEGVEIECGAGASLRSVCIAAQKNGLSGLEFAYGIPGTVGGAFFMNAGAYGGEIKNVAKSAVCLKENGEIVEICAGDMNFGYRTSIFKTEKLTVLSVKLELKKGKPIEIKQLMDDYFSRRTDKQPLDYPSAGSTFKRPAGYFAGALIEKNGLKGYSSGGAEVSQKHAGFVINKGNATAKDVLAVMDGVRKKVYENDGVELESEVIFVGRKDKNL